MGKVTFTAKIVARAGRMFPGRGAARRILREEFEGQLAPRILRVGRQTAPRRSGKLGRGLRANVSRAGAGVSIELRSTVRSAQGFPYTAATRFGRRAIVARRGRALRIPLPGGGVIYRKRVRGYRPSHDWADDTARAAQPHIARSAQRVGRRLQGAIG